MIPHGNYHNINRNLFRSNVCEENEQPLLIKPGILLGNVDELLGSSKDLLSVNSASSSRRPSAIVATLRRPSQAITLSAIHVIMKNSEQFAG